MLRLRGGPAHSPFRIERQIARLRELLPSLTGLRSEFVHFVDTARPLNESELSDLEALLDTGHAPEGSEWPPSFIVVPRPGTISPWSSKATDILHNCGLQAVNRVERGVAYDLLGADGPIFVLNWFFQNE
mgnify:CR=1 FL=1